MVNQEQWWCSDDVRVDFQNIGCSGSFRLPNVTISFVNVEKFAKFCFTPSHLHKNLNVSDREINQFVPGTSRRNSLLTCQPNRLLSTKGLPEKKSFTSDVNGKTSGFCQLFSHTALIDTEKDSECSLVHTINWKYWMFTSWAINNLLLSIFCVAF